MIRGTNQPFKFDLPCNFSDLQSVKIVFWQEGYNGPEKTRPLPILKRLTDCMQGQKSNQLVVTLNAEETLRFSDKIKAKTQLWGATNSGAPVASIAHLITVYPIYDDSIIDEELLPVTSDDVVPLDGQEILTDSSEVNDADSLVFDGHTVN